MTHDPMCAISSTRCGGRDMKHHSLWSEPPAECEKCGAECDCDLIAKVRAECADVVASFDWSPETDHADIERLVAELRGEPYP